MAMTGEQVLQVTVLGKSVEQAVNNVFHYVFANPAEVPIEGVDIAFFFPSFQTIWRSQICPLLQGTYAVQTYQLRTLINTVEEISGGITTRRLVLGDAFDAAGTALDTGGVATEASPTFVAVGMRKATNKAGRRFRGGTRFGPIAEADTLGNQVGGLAFPAWEAAATNFTQTHLIPGIPGIQELLLVVFSKESALEANPPQPNLRQYSAGVVAGIVSPFLTSQVSRKQRGSTPA